MAGFSVSCTAEGLFFSRPSAPSEIYAFYVGVDGRLKFGQKAALPPRPAIARTIHADAVYGAFALLKGYYIALITKAAAVATAPHGASILQVQDMEWVLVGNGYATSVKESEKGAVGTTLTAAQQHEEDTHLALLKRIAETRSFYYSHDYDMTNSVQRNDSIDSGALTPQISPSTPRPKWVHSDERFWWNKSALREVLAAAATDSVASSSAASHPYAVPVINGFVGHRPIPEFASDLLLISRRACGRQGTRFNMRGADHEGNVANYAETEQIVVQGTGAVSSYVQVRGSIPLLWEQPVTLKYTPRCALYDSKTINQSVFNKHMAALLDRYSRVTAVNLIDKKGDQKVLGQAYSDASASFPHPASYRYVWWDFHGETKSSKGGWKSLGKLLQEVQAEVAKDGVYSKDADGNVLSIQKGTVRTNCMDNLDRTNVVQSLFARHAAVTVLPGAADRVRAAGGNIMSTPYPEFERAFNNLWADNADAMSVLYSGTGALKTDFTRTGKRTLAGALQDGVNSVHRYILNNLDDGRTQDAWDLFLGRYVPVRVGMAASKGGSYSPAMAAHLAGPTPGGVFARVAALFGLLTVAIAGGLVSHKHSAGYRLCLGMGGATGTLLVLAWAVVSKGWLKPLAGALVSRPSFVPSLGGGRDESYAIPGREKDGVIGGAHAREHSTLAPGAAVAAHHPLQESAGALEDGTRVKTA